MLRLHREAWTHDRNYPQCHLCKATFTWTNRRHHCRICGLVFCEKCTSGSVSTAGASYWEGNTVHPVNHNVTGESIPLRVRVCTSCAVLHKDRQGQLQLQLDSSNMSKAAATGPRP